MRHGTPVLLIEDDQDYERLVSEVLAASAGMFDLKSAPSLAAGLPLIDQHAPQVILVDLNIADSAGYETFLRVREHAHGIPIIVLTALDDDRVAIRAVEDGAQDYLVKSFIQPKLLARCMNMALSRQRRQAPREEAAPGPGLVLSFIGSKGGVGTSTTAVNIAALLAQNGLETAVIELQPGRPGTLSVYLQTEPAQGLSSLLKKPADAITIAALQQCLAEEVSGLHLLVPTSSDGLWPAPDADHARNIISVARSMYRFVVLDLPPLINEAVAQALEHSDSVTMVSDRELASLQSGAAFIQQIRMATSGTRELSLALVDRTGLETPVPLAEVKSQLKMHPLAIIPRAAASIAFSHSAKTPLVLLYPDDPFSLAHFELAEHLLAPIGADRFARPGQSVLRHKSSWPTIPETTYG